MSRPIDADALKEIIKIHDYPLRNNLNSIDDGMWTLGIMQAIDSMPTIEAGRPKGKLLLHTFGANYFYTCGNCNRKISKVKFCPHCGADMRKETE